MALFVFGGFLTVLFNLPLKYLNGLWEKEQAPGWSTYAAGTLSWCSIASFGMMVVGFFNPIIGMFTKPGTSQGYELSFMTLGVAALAKLNVVNPEFLDLPHMVPFIRHTLLFENIAGKRLNIAEELDKFEVRKVYKDVTGKELAVEKKPVPRFQRSREDLEREVTLLQGRKIVTPHLQSELNALNRGETTEISDSWKINALRGSAHTFYQNVKHVQIDPVRRTISFSLDFGEMNIDPLKQHRGLVGFYQELYEFLQAMSTESAMKPYQSYYQMITLTCLRTVLDGFAGATTVAFFSLGLSMTELKTREGKFFNPAELPRIATVQFNQGDVIADTLN
jgi:hypothetical protein